MEQRRVRILLVDDDREDYILTREMLADARRMKFDLEWVSTFDAALEAMGQRNHDVYLLDYRLGAHTGLELLRLAVADGCKAPIIMLTGINDPDADLEAMKAGAADFLVKGEMVAALLERSIHFALERKQVEETLRQSQKELLSRHDDLKRLYGEVEKKNDELEKAYAELKATQGQLLQQEKMASIGQLAAGVAHEINNPMGFIASNLGTLGKYMERLTGFMARQEALIAGECRGEEAAGLAEERKRLKIDHISADVQDLVRESLEGAERVKKIVQDLKSFSRVDDAGPKPVNLNDCLESTLNIVWNELKYKATVNREYGELPEVVCNPGQLNQVFMNLLVNAAHAIDKQGEITVRSWPENGAVCVSVADTGCGMPPEVQRRIFEPFFTTKEVGTGTGLGLAIAYDIVKKHHGEILVESEVGEGTTFTVKIPKTPATKEQEAA